MYYIRRLDMFRAIVCSSSGGPNCILQHLVRHSLWAAVQCTGWEWTNLYYDARPEKHQIRLWRFNVNRTKLHETSPRCSCSLHSASQSVRMKSLDNRSGILIKSDTVVTHMCSRLHVAYLLLEGFPKCYRDIPLLFISNTNKRHYVN
jgi:hypothetical protein